MCETLEGFERKGYDYPFLTLTFTNEWRCDNDGPMPQLLAFIKKWNEMGFKPMLRMKTAGEAMRNIEKEIGNQLRTFEGEWQDWWALVVQLCHARWKWHVVLFTIQKRSVRQYGEN